MANEPEISDDQVAANKKTEEELKEEEELQLAIALSQSEAESKVRIFEFSGRVLVQENFTQYGNKVPELGIKQEYYQR